MLVLSKPLQERVEWLESRIGYNYAKKEYGLQAIVHSSYTHESTGGFTSKSNERLEFLGDAVLDFVLGKMLFLDNPEMSEGEMSKTRAMIVCEASLSRCAEAMALGDILLLGKGELANGGRKRPSILSDCVEAIIGSIYLDGGMDHAERFIRNILTETYQKALEGNLFMDYKTALQETLQRTGEVRIEYRLLGSSGPDHSKSFSMGVFVGDKMLGSGEGKSKKEAEQAAAKAALDASTPGPMRGGL